MFTCASRKCAFKYQLYKSYVRPLTTPKPIHTASNALRTLGSSQHIPLAMAKRKNLSTAMQGAAITTVPIHPPPFDDDLAPPSKRRASQRRVSQPKPDTASTNPDKNANVLDAPEALRASPDGDETMNLGAAGMDVEKQVKNEDSDSPLSDMEEVEEPVEKEKVTHNDKTVAAAKKGGQGGPAKKAAVAPKDKKELTSEPQFLDPEAEGDEEADEENIQAALSRPPPVNSDYLPLPWKGRLGYVGVVYENSRFVLTLLRLAYVHISASRTLLYSVLELVELHLY